MGRPDFRKFKEVLKTRLGLESSHTALLAPVYVLRFLIALHPMFFAGGFSQEFPRQGQESSIYMDVNT
jgi:hypothetical protein